MDILVAITILICSGVSYGTVLDSTSKTLLRPCRARKYYNFENHVAQNQPSIKSTFVVLLLFLQYNML